MPFSRECDTGRLDLSESCGKLAPTMILLLLRSAESSPLLAPHRAEFLPIVCSTRAAAANETTSGNLEERLPTSSSHPRFKKVKSCSV
jgi:hypothetical protein